MGSTVTKKQPSNRVKKNIEIILSRKTFIIERVQKASWLSEEKQEAIVMMIEIFTDFAKELQKREGK
ncbi:MAG: hypothetical protein FP820_09960 [Sulfurimonas sp.]|nr:hypothetical protein [Sulfurimonas sp.]MBU3939603.1 hypothetical protein [bacterium]